MIKWKRNRDYPEQISPNYVDSEGRFKIQQYGRNWLIYSQQGWNILDAMPTLRDAKAYCETEAR